MKILDLVNIAFNYTIRNKKTMKSIIGISMVFMIFIIILWIFLSVFLQYPQIADKTPIDNVINIDYADEQTIISGYRDTGGTLGSDSFLYGNKEKNNLLNKYDNHIEEKIVSQYIQIRQNQEIVNINNQEYTNNDYIELYKFIDLDKSDGKIMLSSQKNELGSDGQKLLIGEGFEGNGKGQIIVSEKWLEKFSLKEEDVLNKKIAITLDVDKIHHNLFKYEKNYVLDNDNIVDNEHINENEYTQKYMYEGDNICVLKDFTVKGIIKKGYYDKKFNKEEESEIILSTSSLYDDNGNSYLPIIKDHKICDENYKADVGIATYKTTDYNALANEANEKGMFFPFIVQGSFYSKLNYTSVNTLISNTPITSLEIQMDSYGQAKKLYNKVYMDSKSDENLANKKLVDSVRITNFFDKLLIVLGLSGAVIFIVTMINYYNNLSYIYKNRKKYIGIEKAMGMKKYDIYKIIFLENLIINFLACVIAVIFSVIICYFITLKFNSIFSEFFTLNWYYYLLSCIIVSVLLFLISNLFVMITSIKYSKSSIINLIKG
ncbi:MAG: ABC transporter permease [Clostridia bacterium]